MESVSVESMESVSVDNVTMESMSMESVSVGSVDNVMPMSALYSPLGSKCRLIAYQFNDSLMPIIMS